MTETAPLALTSPWLRRSGTGFQVDDLHPLFDGGIALRAPGRLDIVRHDATTSLHLDVRTIATWGDDRLVAVTNDETLAVIDVADGRLAVPELPLNVDSEAITLALAVDHRGWAATAGDERGITVHDLASGAAVASWEDLDEGTTCLAFLPDGHLVSGGWEGQIRVWDPATGALLPGPLFGLVDGELWGHRDAVSHLVPFEAPDGSWRLASSGEDRTVRVWDLVTGRELGGTIRSHDAIIRGLVVDGSRVVSVGAEGRIVVVDDDGNLVSTRELGPVTVWDAAIVSGELALALDDGWGTVALP